MRSWRQKILSPHAGAVYQFMGVDVTPLDCSTYHTASVSRACLFALCPSRPPCPSRSRAPLDGDTSRCLIARRRCLLPHSSSCTSNSRASWPMRSVSATNTPKNTHVLPFMPVLQVGHHLALRLVELFCLISSLHRDLLAKSSYRTIHAAFNESADCILPACNSVTVGPTTIAITR